MDVNRVLRLLTVRVCLTWCLCIAGWNASVFAAAPAPPSDIIATDYEGDNGTKLIVAFKPSQADNGDNLLYIIERSTEFGGLYHELATIQPTKKQLRQNRISYQVDEGIRGRAYWFRVAARNELEETSVYLATDQDAGVSGEQEIYDSSRMWLLVITLAVCGSVMAFIWLARTGADLKIRPIAGLEAIEEAVGRATEMGRSCLFVPGIQDMNDLQTISGLSILSRVAQRAAEYDCKLETPTSKSLVMTAARETVATAFLAAGRPDAYNEDLIYYVTDEQFAYVSFLSSKMVREKPAACFYLGAFFAEALILAETGNEVGAIQVAGTAQPGQLPFFVAACDYTLIGEEFFAASAYLSGDPDQLGSLKGQDVGKLIVGSLIIIGVILISIMEFSSNVVVEDAATYLLDVVLHASG